jgi:hypothetical protein
MAEGGGVEPRDRDLRSPLVFRTSCQPSSSTFRNLAERAGFGPAQVHPDLSLAGRYVPIPSSLHALSWCPERDSNSYQQRSQRCASTHCAIRAIFDPPGSIRTITVRVLSAVPLPVGIRAEETGGSGRTRTFDVCRKGCRVYSAVPSPLGHAPWYSGADSNRQDARFE